jgi:hypothetical protein
MNMAGYLLSGSKTTQRLLLRGVSSGYKLITEVYPSIRLQHSPEIGQVLLEKMTEYQNRRVMSVMSPEDEWGVAWRAQTSQHNT